MRINKCYKICFRTLKLLNNRNAISRFIKVAFDKTSGEILEADDVFDTAKNSFELRRQYHRDEVELYCCECDQKLNVSSSKYDRLHFKHQPNASFCYLKSEPIQRGNRPNGTALSGKESARHKTLRNKIAGKTFQHRWCSFYLRR